MIPREFIRLLTSPLRGLPDFIVAGEAKCGTTSLYRLLCRHPSILSADMKEPHNFIRYGASPHFCRQHYPLVTAFWLQRCRHPGARVLTGEATANYFSTEGVPERIKAVVPGAKIIIAFRDPVVRAYSDYEMMRKGGFEAGDFDTGIQRVLDWILDPELEPLVAQARRDGEGFLRYVFKGDYAVHLQRWLDVFPREQLLFIESERFFADPQRELSRIFSWLSLPDHRIDATPVHKQGSYGGCWMSQETERRLRAFYAPRNEALRQMTGLKLSWPS